MKKLLNIANKLPPYLTLCALIVLWELAVRINRIPEYILPSPVKVAETGINSYKLLCFHTSTTLYEALLGFFISIITAFLMAFLMDNIKWLKQAFYPLIIVSQTIPLIVLAVLFIIWFGFGPEPKILVVILVCFFPLLISFMKGLESVDSDLISLFKSMGATKMTIFKMVKLPAAMPAFFSGLRISATYSIMAAVIGEWMGAQRGLGYFMTLAQRNFRIDQVLAAVIVISLLSLAMVKAVDLMEYIFIPWNRKQADFNSLY